MDASSTESGSDNPSAAKRLKRELPADDDEDISIEGVSTRGILVNVSLAQVAGGSSATAEPSQLTHGQNGEDNQDSKIAEFRTKMLKYEEEASHLRTQLKREQVKALKAEREKDNAEGVKRYLEEKCEEERKRANEAEAVAQQQAAAAEKKVKNLQKQCERLETKVLSKDAEIDFRDKELGNAAKDLSEAQKKAEDAEKEAVEAKKKVTDAEQKAAEADAKKESAEKKLEEIKKAKVAAESKLKATIRELENQLANNEASEQPSSSTDGQLGERFNEANRRIAQQEEEITKLRADNDKLKKGLTASKAKATRLENARKRSVQEKDDEVRSLQEEIEGLQYEIVKLKKRTNPETVLDARLETARLRQAIGRFEGLTEKVMMKYDDGGVAVKSVPSRPTLPKVVLELQPSFFDKYDCRREYLVQIDYVLLLKGIASQAGKEHCRILKKYNEAMGIGFKSADGENYVRALTLTLVTARNAGHAWTLIEDDPRYPCTFEMNSFVLAKAAQTLSPVLLDFSNRDGPDAVAITDSEDRLSGAERDCLWRSLPGNNPHVNDFKAEFTSTTPDTHLRIFVDPKYLRRCVMASSDAGSKTVEVALSEDILRLRYGNEHFTLTYYIPTVKPTENGERCYSPIEYGTETFEI